MTWNRPMAPEEERAQGLPQDSICMTVAAKLTSTLFCAAQRPRLAAQNWISGVNSAASSPLRGAGRGAACGTAGSDDNDDAAGAGSAGTLVNPATNATSRPLMHR